MSSTTANKPASGFTLIEMLVIAPLVILAIGAFLAIMINMVGEVMATRARNTAVYDTQSTLNQIEQDVRLSTQFMTTTGALYAPQGSDNNFTGTAAFTNADSSTLILSTLATTTNPANPSRQLVYYANQPNACGATQSSNKIFRYTIVYFVKDSALWRRTIIPPHNTTGSDQNTVCSSIWQLDSCSPPYSPSAHCETNDEELLDNVSSVTIEYFPESDDTTAVGAASAPSATTIEATLAVSGTAGTRSYSNSGVIRATRLNAAPSS